MASVCRSTTKKKENSVENNELTLDSIATDKVYSKHQIGSISQDAKSRRRVMGQIQYDMESKRFVSRSLHQDIMLSVTIVMDKKGY